MEEAEDKRYCIVNKWVRLEESYWRQKCKEYG